ncbi:DUF3383 family protein [Saccharibacter sp. 17.LH.SD]|uniref:DUF3383 family protein n=1 Tax=Saccharibacter sp. 17.LH.SD TaxID=2689393 RepID=UPI001367D6BD|nr:DUF3383 family protein [Saccharibacter sp. 17.LH.SD]MXV44402.1 DUF3383 family protein [Saccharibacter sp. 17.LH.SD]
MSTFQGSIPISRLVKVTPSALEAAGGVSFINGLIVTNNTSVIADRSFQSFTSSSDVAKAFTPASVEAQMAAVYFSSYRGSLQTPSKLYFAGISAESEADMAAYMNDVINKVQDFVGITTSFEPSFSQKQVLAQWTGAQADRYWYVPWDTDEQALTAENNASFGTWLKAQSLEGTTLVYKDPLVSALCLGWMASLDFDATNGRTTLAGRQNGLITPSVSNAQDADTLQKKGYSFYGAYANGLGSFQFLEDGSVSGQFLWADSYINQIWLNASFQADLINLLLSVGQIPYNTQGDALISASVQDTINQAVNFGAIRAGVTLTEAQQQQIDSTAGSSISSTVQSRGWYFQPNASATPAATRVKRGSPPCRFWYTDGQSVQSINLASIEVQ